MRENAAIYYILRVQDDKNGMKVVILLSEAGPDELGHFQMIKNVRRPKTIERFPGYGSAFRV